MWIFAISYDYTVILYNILYRNIRYITYIVMELATYIKYLN